MILSAPVSEGWLYDSHLYFVKLVIEFSLFYKHLVFACVTVVCQVI